MGAVRTLDGEVRERIRRRASTRRRCRGLAIAATSAQLDWAGLAHEFSLITVTEHTACNTTPLRPGTGPAPLLHAAPA